MNFGRLSFIFGCVMVLVGVFLFYQMFFIAYFNGGEAVVRINTIGEANFEALLLLFAAPFIINFFWSVLWKE